MPRRRWFAVAFSSIALIGGLSAVNPQTVVEHDESKATLEISHTESETNLPISSNVVSVENVTLPEMISEAASEPSHPDVESSQVAPVIFEPSSVLVEARDGTIELNRSSNAASSDVSHNLEGQREAAELANNGQGNFLLQSEHSVLQYPTEHTRRETEQNDLSPGATNERLAARFASLFDEQMASAFKTNHHHEEAAIPMRTITSRDSRSLSQQASHQSSTLPQMQLNDPREPLQQHTESINNGFANLEYFLAEPPLDLLPLAFESPRLGRRRRRASTVMRSCERGDLRPLMAFLTKGCSSERVALQSLSRQDITLLGTFEKGCRELFYMTGGEDADYWDSAAWSLRDRLHYTALEIEDLMNSVRLSPLCEDSETYLPSQPYDRYDDGNYSPDDRQSKDWLDDVVMETGSRARRSPPNSMFLEGRSPPLSLRGRGIRPGETLQMETVSAQNAENQVAVDGFPVITHQTAAVAIGLLLIILIFSIIMGISSLVVGAWRSKKIRKRAATLNVPPGNMHHRTSTGVGDPNLSALSPSPSNLVSPGSRIIPTSPRTNRPPTPGTERSGVFRIYGNAPDGVSSR